MNSQIEKYIESLDLSGEQRKEVFEFFDKNEFLDIIEEAIQEVEEGEFFHGLSKIIGYEQEKCFIANGMVNLIPKYGRVYFEKDQLIKILEESKPYLEVLDDE